MIIIIMTKILIIITTTKNNNNIETKTIPQFIHDKHNWTRQIFYYKQGEIYTETEGFMIGVQDEVNNTEIYGEYISLNLLFIKVEICKECSSGRENTQPLLPV
jgi:hypothetical protein